MPKLPPKPSISWELGDLLAAAGRLRFEPHRIAHLLDDTGRYQERLDDEFPFLIRLFLMGSRHLTPALTWHERLELLLPLDGPLLMQMGEDRIDLAPGDLLGDSHDGPGQKIRRLHSPGQKYRGGIERCPVSFPKKEANLLERERHDTSKQKGLTSCTCPDEVGHRFEEAQKRRPGSV